MEKFRTQNTHVAATPLVGHTSAAPVRSARGSRSHATFLFKRRKARPATPGKADQRFLLFPAFLPLKE